VPQLSPTDLKPNPGLPTAHGIFDSPQTTALPQPTNTELVILLKYLEFDGDTVAQMSQTEAPRSESLNDHDPTAEQKKVKNRRPASKLSDDIQSVAVFLGNGIVSNNTSAFSRYCVSAAAIKSMAVSAPHASLMFSYSSY